MIAPRCALLGALITAAACAPRGAPGPGFLVPPPRSLAAPSACDLPGDSTAAPDTLTVAASGAIDPAHAPSPVTPAERVLFRQLYETLLRSDCEGRLHPALAATWSSADGGRTWTLTIADSARFWDGVPVGARDVIASWGAAITSVADSVVASGDRTVTVHLRRPTLQGPLALADPALAVAKRVPGIAWPIGTGSYWVSADLTASPVGGQHRPVLKWRTAAGDARDLLDAGVDLLVTDDPTALAYAATRADFTSVPLPWDRSYVLLAPVPVRIPAPTLEDLARHAVRVEARPAVAPFWWQDSTCGAGPPAGTTSIGRRRGARPRRPPRRAVARRAAPPRGGGPPGRIRQAARGPWRRLVRPSHPAHRARCLPGADSHSSAGCAPPPVGAPRRGAAQHRLGRRPTHPMIRS